MLFASSVFYKKVRFDIFYQTNCVIFPNQKGNDLFSIAFPGHGNVYLEVNASIKTFT